MENGSFIIHQKSFADRITPLETDISFSDLRSKRQELAWLVHTRPDLACAVNISAQVKKDEFCTEDIKNINKIVSSARKYSYRGILQQKLDRNSLIIAVYSDAAFSTRQDHKSQLRYLILLCDGNNNCNILHFSSTKSKRIALSVLGSEVYALADGFDYGFCLKQDLETILGKRIPLQMLTDAKCVFDAITRSSSCREKGLLIDIAVLKEAYSKD